MALNIKNRRAEDLASEVARETGESMTQAVIRALEERLERLRGRKTIPDVVERIQEIATRCQALPDLDPRSPEEILGYDRTGAFR
jgi:antitoxin VapB